MKLLLFLALLASAAVAQATVSVERVQPNCGALGRQMGFSQCFAPRIEVTARSINTKTLGFYFVMTYRDYMGAQKTTSVSSLNRETDGSFKVTFLLGDVSILNVSALELVAGEVAYAP